MRHFIKLLVAAVLAGASAFLAATGPDQHQGWRITAAIIATMPSAYLVGSRLVGRFRPSDQARSSVDALLRGTILDLGDEELGGKLVFREQIGVMSFHVWLTPVWYRRMYHARRVVRQMFERAIGPERTKRLIFKPTLDRFSVIRFAAHEPSEVTFKKGIGLVGICIERNRKDKALIVDFETEEMKALLSCSEKEWKKAPVEKTLNLKHHEEFKKLADKYGQAVAFVIREEATGEPVGCLTFDLPPESPIRIQDYDAPLAPSGEIALTPHGRIFNSQGQGH